MVSSMPSLLLSKSALNQEVNAVASSIDIVPGSWKLVDEKRYAADTV